MRARPTVAGAVALTVHAALLLALREYARAPDVPDLELEITADAPEPVVTEPVVTEPSGGGDRSAHPTSAVVAVVARAPVVALAAPATDGSATTPAREFSPLGASADLGLGRAILLPGPLVEPPPTALEPPQVAVGAVTEALRERDLGLGLGPEGPILSALTAGTHASLAPLHGAATFEATIDADGRITQLRVVDGADAGWEDAHARALEALAGKIANLRGRDGAVVRVLVSSTTLEPPKGVLGKAGAILFLEPGELARKQQRTVHVRLLSVR